MVIHEKELKGGMFRTITHELLCIITFPNNRVSKDSLGSGTMHFRKEG